MLVKAGLGKSGVELSPFDGWQNQQVRTAHLFPVIGEMTGAARHSRSECISAPSFVGMPAAAVRNSFGITQLATPLKAGRTASIYALAPRLKRGYNYPKQSINFQRGIMSSKAAWKPDPISAKGVALLTTFAFVAGGLVGSLVNLDREAQLLPSQQAARWDGRTPLQCSLVTEKGTLSVTATVDGLSDLQILDLRKRIANGECKVRDAVKPRAG